MDGFCESDAPLKRFVKKIPPSGSSPAYKLTLPHQIVRGHLLHLIESDFELASSPDAIHTWQGSIVPRRNKDRSEYTLQGWKLWAEAHSIQSGDQVSFELITPRKMVLTVIKREVAHTPGNSPERIRKASSPLPDFDMPPPLKTLKASGSASPADSPLSDHTPEVPTSLFDASMEADGLDLVWNTLGEDMPEGLANFDVALDDTEPTTDRLSSVKTEEINLESPGAQHMSFSGLALEKEPLTPPTMDHLIANKATHPSGTSNGLSSGVNLPHTNMRHIPPTFADALNDAYLVRQGPLRRNRTMQSLLSGSSSVADGLSEICHFNQNSLGTPRHTDRTGSSKALADRRDSLRVGWRSFQTKLDRETRVAMRAAMGLEKCIVDLTKSSELGVRQSSQADMFRHLSTLKANLWQMLVMSMADEPA